MDSGSLMLRVSVHHLYKSFAFCTPFICFSCSVYVGHLFIVGTFGGIVIHECENKKKEKYSEYIFYL